MRFAVAACVSMLLAGCNLLLGFGNPEAGEHDHDVSVAIVAGPPTTPSFFTFDVQLANSGPGDALNSCVTIQLPVESWFGAQICGGASNTQMTCCQALVAGTSTRLRLLAAFADGDISAAMQSSDPFELDASNDHATLAIPNHADLEVLPLIEGNTEVVGTGRLQSYTFRVRNLGPGNVHDVKLDVSATPGFVPQGGVGNGWTCDSFTCTLASLPAMTLAYSLKWSALTPTTVGQTTVTGTVSSSSPDPSTGNNSTTYMQRVTTDADLGLGLAATPDPVAPGGTLTYTLGVQNYGPSDVTSVTVTDTLPAGVTFVSASGVGWTCSNAGQTVTCTRPMLAVMYEGIDVVVTAPSTAGMITNTVNVSSANPELNTANNTKSITTTVGP